MRADPALIWVYLTREPLLWLTATLAAYLIGDAAFRASGRRPSRGLGPASVAVLASAAMAWRKRSRRSVTCAVGSSRRLET